MAENQEAPEAEAQATPVETSPAAVALALGRTSKTAKALDEDARTFLREQTDLIRLQKEHLHEQRMLVLSRLALGRWKDRFSLALQTMTAIVGVAVVIAIATMAWQAHEARGLVVDAFSVPPDIARDGLTGEVAASRFLDKLQALQTATSRSDRPEESFQNNWGSEIKVDIPETGLTFGEFEKLLREKLGHVAHVTGEVLKTPDGIAVTSRIGGAPPQTFTGPEGSFDDLAQKAAEAVYRANQPYRFAEYLDDRGRVDEAFAVIADLAANGPRSEQGWAFAKWSQMDLNDRGDVEAARAHAAAGQGFTPGSDIDDQISIVGVAVWSGHDEVNLIVSRALEVAVQQRVSDTSQLFYIDSKLLGHSWLTLSEPDYKESAKSWTRTASADPNSHFSTSNLDMALAATAYARDHDLAAARQTASPAVKDETGYMWNVAIGAFPALPNYWMAADQGDWQAALADARGVDAWLEAHKTEHPIYVLLQKVWIWPLEALAEARTGDAPGAGALIDRTPLDCSLCLRVRGQIAAATGDWPGADRWFGEAVRQAPSVSLGYAEWGEALLAKGDVDGAVARSMQAHRLAPHFADPSETWGEALARKGDDAGAVAQFREANENAPHWGRNHLLWGQALARLGRKNDARAQFHLAAGLDLSAADRATLNRVLKAS